MTWQPPREARGVPEPAGDLAVGASAASGERPGIALVVVRNSVEHDARVLRAARTLARIGYETTVLGVASFSERRAVSEAGGVTIKRIGPSSRLAWAVYQRISHLSPPEPRVYDEGATEAKSAAAPDKNAKDAGASEANAAAASTASGTTAIKGVGRRLLRFAATLAYYRRAIAVVRAMRPDLVHCNDYNTMWIGVAARLLAGSAVIYDSHELWPDRNLRQEPRWWVLLCEALFVRAAHRVITTSPAYAELMAQRYRIAEPVVVRNIPEPGPEAPEPGTLRPRPERDGPPVAIYVGGLQPNRGLEQSIRALVKAPAVKLRLVGPATPAAFRLELERLVRSLGLEDRVELSDPVPPMEVVDALVDADVGLALIQPAQLSYRLTLPNKLFEYALAGLPILGSDLPMIARFVNEHELGMTTDPEDVDAIAAKLEELVEPARNARYREAVARAAIALDWRRERELLVDVYRDASARA